MSAALVRKSLALVDDSTSAVSGRGKKAGGKGVLIPENQKVIRKVNRKGRKAKINLLQREKKLTVVEAKKTFKSEEQIFKENLKKLRLIREAATIQLDDETTSRLIERAVTRRPVQAKEKDRAPEKTAFTEEDFKRFEEEYFDE